MKEYLNKKWRWENYITFFDIQIFRYLLMWFSLVPIIAGLIGQLPTPLPISISGVVYKIELTLPFSWQLLWLSSFSFVIAFIIYKLWCPDFIIKYNSYSDYLARSHDRRWLSWESYYMWTYISEEQKQKFLDVALRKEFAEMLDDAVDFSFDKKPIVEKEQTVFYFKHQEKKYKLASPSLKQGIDNENQQCGLFYEIFGRYTSSKIGIRFVIFLLLFLSLLLFSLAFIQHICRGWEFVYKWLV